MKLLEYQAKRVFAEFGISVPKGEVATTPEAVAALFSQADGPVAVKAQVPTGGRGKAGGVGVAKSAEEATALAKRILSLSIKGFPVKKVLVEAASDIATEYYAAVTVDRARQGVVFIVSASGGMDIEEIAAKTPEKVFKLWVDARFDLEPYQLRQLFYGAGFDPARFEEIAATLATVYRILKAKDASLVEINPLVIAKDGRVLALDAKMEIDDNALFRHPEFETAEAEAEEGGHPLEVEAKKLGLAYVKLDGNVGIIGNGAGLVMASLDTVKHYGGAPANFLDLGGGARADVVEKALHVVFSDPDVKALMINIFGGITRCDEVAKGLISVLSAQKSPVPIVVRLAGTRQAEGLELLGALDVTAASTLPEAAQKAVALAAGQ